MMDLAIRYTDLTTLRRFALPANSNFSVAFSMHLDEVKEWWDKLAPANNIFLQYDYLRVLEHFPPDKMRFVYGIILQENKPVGIMACQIQYFKAEESINDFSENGKKQKDPCFFTLFSRLIKDLVTKKVEYDSLVCGSLLLTGEHGFYFKEESGISGEEAYELVNESLSVCRTFLEEENIRVSLTLIKDFYCDKLDVAKTWRESNYNEFKIQPNMVMPLNSAWRNMDDYLSAMTSKYRVRVRRAWKKAKPLSCEEFDLEQIEQHQELIYQLYLNIARDVGFNAVKLHPAYFSGLKKSLDERFRFFVYRIDGQIIAFYTAIHNAEELEAHFLGMDKQANIDYQMYLNILIDLVGLGIKKKARRIIFARTAMEIKSSIGAEPVDMWCYLKHRSSFANRFLNPLLEYLSPDEGDWQQRHPFKAGEKAELLLPVE